MARRLDGPAHAEVLVDVSAVHGDDVRHAEVGREALREGSVGQRLMGVQQVVPPVLSDGMRLMRR